MGQTPAQVVAAIERARTEDEARAIEQAALEDKPVDPPDEDPR